MRDNVRDMQARMREAQDVKITNGPIMQVMEGGKHVTEALRDAVRRPGDRASGEFPDTSGYDPVLKFHTRT